MAKQPMTEEQRKAVAERFRLAREKKAAEKEAVKNSTEFEHMQPSEVTTTETKSPDGPQQYESLPKEPEAQAKPNISDEDLASLLRRIAELERSQAASSLPFSPGGPLTPSPNMGYPQYPQVTPGGRLTGTFEKFVVDPKHYPDPSERLAAEPRLASFAFPINYELEFDVSTTTYQTQDGINTREPRFTLKLIRIVMDDDGYPTTGRYVLRTLMAHEDPQAALTVARQQGIDPESFGGEVNFLNEMRYLRFRDWLVEAFYPPRNTGKKNTKEMVIGNRVVDFYETNGQDSQKIPFDKLNGKV